MGRGRDKKVRKRRCDRKHPYRKKHGKFVPYVSKRQKGDPIKIWFWRVQSISLEGYKHFNAQSRLKMRRIVYIPYIRADVPPERLSTVQEVKDLALEILGHEGSFILKTFMHGKNKFRVTNRAVAEITIRKYSDGLKAFVKPSYKNRGLYRYWFWQGEGRRRR